MTPSRPLPEIWYPLAQFLLALRALIRAASPDGFAAIAARVRRELRLTGALVRRYLFAVAYRITLPPPRAAPPRARLRSRRAPGRLPRRASRRTVSARARHPMGRRPEFGRSPARRAAQSLAGRTPPRLPPRPGQVAALARTPCPLACPARRTSRAGCPPDAPRRPRAARRLGGHAPRHGLGSPFGPPLAHACQPAPLTLVNAH